MEGQGASAVVCPLGLNKALPEASVGHLKAFCHCQRRITSSTASNSPSPSSQTLIEGLATREQVGLVILDNFTTLTETRNGAGPSADLARTKRTVDGARGDRLRQGQAAEANHGGDFVHRARCAEHGDDRRHRSFKPLACAHYFRRYIHQSSARSGHAASRALRPLHRVVPPKSSGYGGKLKLVGNLRTPAAVSASWKRDRQTLSGLFKSCRRVRGIGPEVPYRRP